MSAIQLVMLAVIAFVILTALMLILTRYKRCPSDKILVIYGKTGQGSARCVAGGAAFVWPIIQSYEYLDLSPISIDVDLRGALSKQNIRVNVPSRFTVAISNEPGAMVNAAERLLGKPTDEIREIAKDIIFGQLRLVVATMDIEEINADRDKFLSNVSQNVGSELRKIGLSLINVNVTDIQDESGYIEALGKEAAAKAINDAKKSVAEKDRDGSIGQALALQDQRIQVSESDAKAQIGEAAAQAKAIEGENEAKILIAQSEARRRQREAEAEKEATASEKVQKANALEESFKAEASAEEARAAKERATREADIIVQAEIAKKKLELEAEAEAEKIRRIAKGQAEATFIQQKAEADGQFEILKRQAEGFEEIVKATNGNPREAVLMLIADKLPELVATQVEAIKNIKIDKVTVWDGGAENTDGGNSTSKFISGLYKSVPPMKDLFDMAGMELPAYLGKEVVDSPPLNGKAEHADENGAV
ncbi:MAG: SPFH domain-containing protein [Bacteroidota bacterium]